MFFYCMILKKIRHFFLILFFFVIFLFSILKFKILNNSIFTGEQVIHFINQNSYYCGEQDRMNIMAYQNLKSMTTKKEQHALLQKKRKLQYYHFLIVTGVLLFYIPGAFGKPVLLHSLATTNYDTIVCENKITLTAKGTQNEAKNGYWEVVTDGATVENRKSRTTVIALQHGINKFVWHTYTSNDTFTVINRTIRFTDHKKTELLCADNTTLKAPDNKQQGTGVWQLIIGSGKIAEPESPVTKVSDVGYGKNIFRWRATDAICSDSVDYILNNYSFSISAGKDVITCSDTASISGTIPEGATGVWYLVKGNAKLQTPYQANTKVTNLSNSVNHIRWTVTNSRCSATDDIVITNNLILADAGKDKVVCDNKIELQANTPKSGTGSWSCITSEGQPVIQNIHTPATMINQLGEGNNTFRWTIKNKNCISYDEIQVVNGEIQDKVRIDFTDVDCKDQCNAAANVYLTNELRDIYYSWIFPDGKRVNKQLISNLCAGNYTAKVIDRATGCSEIKTITISEPEQSLTATMRINKTDCELCNGSVAVEVQGGKPPYKYRWSDVKNTDSIRHNLCKAVYTAKVIDSKSCVAMVTKHLGYKNEFHNPKIVGGSAALYEFASEYSAMQSSKYFFWEVTGGRILGSHTCSSVRIKWNNTGEGIVKLRQSNGCDEKYDSILIEIKELDDLRVQIQSNPRNDKTIISMDELQKYQEYLDNISLRIYNNKGVMIYQTLDSESERNEAIETGQIVVNDTIPNGVYSYKFIVGNDIAIICGEFSIHNNSYHVD